MALAGVAQWIEHQSANQRVAGFIPGQGTCLGCGPGSQYETCERQPHINLKKLVFKIYFKYFNIYSGISVCVYVFAWFSMTVVPNLFGIRDQFHVRQFFHGLEWGDDSSALCSSSPPAVWPGQAPVSGPEVGGV